jgi:hypothetical protein
VCSPIASALAVCPALRTRELVCACGRAAAFAVQRKDEPLRLLCDEHGACWDKVFE